MKRNVCFAVQLRAAVRRASVALNEEDADQVSDIEFDGPRGSTVSESARVHFSTSALDGCDAGPWAVDFGPAESGGSLPNFHGEIRATGSNTGTELILRGSYRLAPRSSSCAPIRAHLSACDSVRAFLDGVGTKILA